MSKNDITGDDIKSRVSTEAFRNQFDTIFGKKKEWVGLTDEEVMFLFKEHYHGRITFENVIDLVEDRLKEKNT